MRYLSATATRELPENTEAGENIGAPVTANDPDNDTLTYTLGGSDVSSFDIGRSTGQIQTKPGVTYDHESKSSYSVTVKADDNNGGTAAIDVTVTVTDVNEPPEFDLATATREVPENTEAGENIGDPVTATDPDTGDTPAYTLEGADADSFDIDSASGQIQTKPGVTYDHESKSSYSVTVKADEKNGGIATIDVTITITVTDVDEPLTVNGETSVGYPENSDGQVATYSATDPDNGQITWSLSGDDAGGFSISNTGELTFQTAPDHESPADDNTDNRYELTVEASDESVKGALDVTVTVTDVNEPPAFSVETASRTIAENTTTGVAIGDPVTATDPDTGDTPAYTLGGTDAKPTSASPTQTRSRLCPTSGARDSWKRRCEPPASRTPSSGPPSCTAPRTSC